MQKKTRKSRNDNIKEWTGQSLWSLLLTADDRGSMGCIIAKTSVGVYHNDTLVSWELVKLVPVVYQRAGRAARPGTILAGGGDTLRDRARDDNNRKLQLKT